jgi:two-component system response regulator MprA
MSTMQKPKVLVVEDDQPIRASIRRALAYEGYAVTEAGDGESALDSIRLSPPDLILLDLNLPGIDGIEVCRRIREAGDVMPIMMITARDAVSDRVIGLDSGADDYLVKPFDLAELTARVRAALRRHEPGPERLAVGDLVVEVEAMQATISDRPVEFTALEFRLLEYLARNDSIVLSRDRILSAVWGLDVETSSNIVDVYIGYLRAKLEEGGERRLIHTIRGAGYVLRPEP